ncbi:hypothetical protein NUW58_g7296 [Xylaria curta]|uniref:Uncharacterized protein n=1 Tax=Xylaria curta TaxID=42375 RepID=A0ACC1NJK0_9PEZI|nr:hypothetical protein NUW58_g7296 [Xylaria curta]
MSLFSDQAWSQTRPPALKFLEASQPWTTARCHRLLRPLVSRIASLRKEIAATGQVRTLPLTSTPATASTSSSRNSGHHEEPNAEPEWLMPRKKRPRLTYAQRRGTQPHQTTHVAPDQNYSGEGHHGEERSLAPGTKPGVRKAFKCTQPETQRKTTSPGEIVASTPILRRARGKIVLSPVAPAHELVLGLSEAGRDRGHRTKAGSSAQKRLDERLNSLRESLPSRFADLEAIYRSFEALLKATATNAIHSTNTATGPRSFLEICLRKVPEYIAELEAWERLDAEQSGTVSTLDDIDTSAEIYNELESFGTNVGWRHLRVVVRADGLNAVKQGIEEGLFGDEFSQLIIDLCVHLGAISEAEDLIISLADRQYPPPSSTESCFTKTPALHPLVTLSSFVSQTKRTSFLFRQYSTLLSTGSLPVEWLATLEFERIWSLAIQGLASTNPSHDAIGFVVQSISLLCCRKRMFYNDADTVQLEQDMSKASQRTLMSALGTLASMSLLGETELKAPWLPESDTRRITAIGDRLKYIIRACINGLKNSQRGRGNQRLDFLYLTLFLSSGNSQGEKIETRVRGNIEALTSLSAKDIYTRNRYDGITWIIASIARACGRGTSVASHQCLDELFKRLESLEIAQNLLDNIKAAAAFLIAQQTNNVRDLIYAESLHSHTHERSSSGTTTYQQSGSTLFTGYRWEETIGEWVTVSPVLNKRRAPTIKRHLRPSSPAGRTGSLTDRSSNSIRPITDSVSDTDGCLYEGMDGGEHSTEERTRHTCNGQGMMRKRPRRIRSTEGLTTKFVSKVLNSQQSFAASAASARRQESQVDPDKENRVRLLAKKPRRSSGRIVLGTRALPRASIGRRDKYGQDSALSDDELCM